MLAAFLRGLFPETGQFDDQIAAIEAEARAIPRPLQKVSAWIPMSREMRIDAGLATPEDIEADRRERAEREARWRALPLPVRLYRGRIRPAFWEARSRLTHAARALRGIECEATP
jgi:hypothetical protein